MENKVCDGCGRSKSLLLCGACQGAVCKACAEFLDEEAFSFLPERPAELTHTTFCPTCFDVKVAPRIRSYELDMGRAREILVFDRSQGKETRLIKRTKDRVKVEDCPDRGEALLRLAFQAVLRGDNALVDVDLRSRKVRDGRYQTTIWSGEGTPVQLDESRLLKDRSVWDNPN